MKVIIITLMFISKAALTLSSSPPSRSYGEICVPNDPSTLCDPSAFLICDTNNPTGIGKCQCETIDMVYNQSQSTCVVFAGKSCSRNPTCISNSHCSTSSLLCECDPNYKFHISGTCLLRRGQLCLKDSDCHIGSHLKCLGKTCECSPSTHLWSEKDDNCLGRHGAQCLSSLGEKCIPNAFCTLDDSTCKCNPDHSPTPDKTCLLKYGAKCDETAMSICNHYNNLVCNSTTTTCQCEYPDTMQYEEDDDKCYVKLGQSCQLLKQQGGIITQNNNKAYECLPNAECSLNSTNVNTCKCKDGTLQTDLGKCEEISEGLGHTLYLSRWIIYSNVVLFFLYHPFNNFAYK